VSDLRPAESVSAKIRHLPHLFPGHGLPRQTSRGDKIQLVTGETAVPLQRRRPPRRHLQHEENTMAITDPVADMLTRLRNAAKAKFSSVDVPGSKMKVEVARILKDEGFIKNYKFLKDGKQGILRIYLKYGQGQAKTIYSLQRVSKPGRRMYVKSKDIKPVLNGMGVSILSTSRGLMTDKQARKENVGGEILCTVS
jgi:small subunit ribosomal protein S8